MLGLSKKFLEGHRILQRLVHGPLHLAQFAIDVGVAPKELQWGKT